MPQQIVLSLRMFVNTNTQNLRPGLVSVDLGQGDQMSALCRSILCGAAVVATACSTPTIGTPEPDEWTMPDLIGRDLQGARDAIQALTHLAVSYTDSTDLTGQDRMQVSGRHWVVCTSTPAPGKTFTIETEIDFGVVRIEETCP
jgi:hypothetical protein